MATITRFPFVSYLRSDTTMHVQHVRGGQVRHEATAAGFWFNPRTAVLAEVPMGDRQEAAEDGWKRTLAWFRQHGAA